MISEPSFNTKRPNGRAKHSLQKINYHFEIFVTNKKIRVIKILNLQDSKNNLDHEHGRIQKSVRKIEYPHTGIRTGG